MIAILILFLVAALVTFPLAWCFPESRR